MESMMKPGRELDALVAEKVMGVTKEEIGYYPSYWESVNGMVDHPRPYSTNIAAAWEVVEKIKESKPLFDLMYSSREKKWQCTTTMELPMRKESVVQADTPPHAICLAALKAVGLDPESI